MEDKESVLNARARECATDQAENLRSAAVGGSIPLPLNLAPEQLRQVIAIMAESQESSRLKDCFFDVSCFLFVECSTVAGSILAAPACRS